MIDLCKSFSGKRVLVTGHTGFKGAWLSLWLRHLGARVTGVGLEPSTSPSMFELVGLADCVDDRRCDIRDATKLDQIVAETRPDFVFHLAAQALVRRSYLAPVDTFSTNVVGTAQVLDSLQRRSSNAIVVVVTSDKCYENADWPWPYRETDPLGGHDPYSSSKACTEIVVTSWRRSFPGGLRIATARAGNVIGGGDWSDDRIVPDCVRSVARGEPIKVRNPDAIRPWQHVLEPLWGYLLLAARLHDSTAFAEPWNFGPAASDARTVRELVDAFCRCWGAGASWMPQTESQPPREAMTLKLAPEKAMLRLGWRPVWSFETAIRETVDWYRVGLEAANMQDRSVVTIQRFSQALIGQG